MSDSMQETQSKPFSITLYARWPDMDFNQHMRNAAYLGASEDCRMTFEARKPIVPPDDLKNLWLALARTPDFDWYPAEASRKQS